MKLIPITEVNDHLIKMFEGWNQEYLKTKSLWDAIEQYDKEKDQIDGDRGFILSACKVPKPDLNHPLYVSIITLAKRTVDDIEVLKQIGISLQFNYYTIKGDDEMDFKVITCMIPEWMLGLTKEEILKEYKSQK